jgi:hypothetical protein
MSENNDQAPATASGTRKAAFDPAAPPEPPAGDHAGGREERRPSAPYYEALEAVLREEAADVAERRNAHEPEEHTVEGAADNLVGCHYREDGYSR